MNLPEPFSYPLNGQAQLKQYQTAKQNNVGLAKSGWGICAALGVRVPKWAAKAENGQIEDRSSDENHPTVTLINSVPYFAASDAKNNIVVRAVAGRQRNMIREAEKIAANAASGFSHP